MSDDNPEPQVPKQHRADALGTKFVEKTGTIQEKAAQKSGHEDDNKDKEPAGGFDDKSIPKAPVGYTVKITFHRAKNLPFADIGTLSSDPYIKAQLYTTLPTRHKEDPPMVWRTQTIHKNVDPEWNSEWIIGNIPANGFRMKARLYDEDAADHDDRLGNVHLEVHNISEKWPRIDEQSFGIKKRMGSKRAYFFRACAAMASRNVHMSGEVFISVQVLGKTDAKNGGRVFTVGPCNWTRHLSPLIGRLAGTKNPEESKDGKSQTERYNFEAHQMQLTGPVPEHLYHRYVEFKPFVAGMFTSHSLRGRILNRALHHQHRRIYNFDGTTTYGSFPEPCKDMTLKFLDFVHWDEGGRIFTYVLTLDGQWRFTETGKEFGIDLLSKHTMHSDVSIYVAWAGEFFIRRLETSMKKPEDQKTHPPADIGNGPPEEDPPHDPSLYQLIIDNDSGTYRPNKDLLPQLKEFMSRNLPGLKITTLDCQGDEEKMKKMKDEQRERRKKEGDPHTYAQGDADSISSSDEERLDNAEGKPKHRNKLQNFAHEIAEPKDKVVEWAQGDKEREQRETEDDTAAMKENGNASAGTGKGPTHAPEPTPESETSTKA